MFSGEDKSSSGPTNSFAAYVLFKAGGGDGPSVMLLRNVSDGAIDYTFTKLLPRGKDYIDIGLKGFGLSHVNEFGDVSAVPLPASGILFGFALAGGAFAARRRQAN